MLAVKFEDAEFSSACQELDVQDLTGWQHFTTTHDVTIYRQLNEATNLYTYKIYGNLRDIQPDLCAKVYMDINYRKTWDSYVKELYAIEENGVSGLYWQVKFPFPMSNRDYTFVRELRELDVSGHHVWVILSRVWQFANKPAMSGVVRVNEFNMSLAITHDMQGGTKAFMRYYDNPGGSIPTWLINWAAQSGVPNFLSQMRTACQGYKQYLGNNGVP